MPSMTPHRFANPRPPYQQGMTLIDLMVGITIGLMAIAVASGALMASRGASGTTTDASTLQQQASYLFRVMGQQARQAASMNLMLSPSSLPSTDPEYANDPVIFAPSNELFAPFKNLPIPGSVTPAVTGKNAPSAGEYKVAFAYQNYTEALTPAGAAASQFRDCLGQQPSATLIRSQFVLTGTELMCAGSDNVPQALIRNVAAFDVRYLVQANTATGMPTVQSLDATAAAAADWRNVFGVQVCIEIFGDEAISMPDGSTYVGCDGNPVNMSSTGSLPANRKNRMHMAFRSVYQLRSQGLAG